MTCDEMGEILQEIIDGEASAETAKMAREHLSKCATCAREYEEMCAAAGKLRQAFKRVDAEKMRRAVLSDPELRTVRIARRPLRLWFEAAALVALVFGVIWLNYAPPAKENQVAATPTVTNEKETPGASQSALFPRKMTLTTLALGAKSGISESRQMIVKNYNELTSLTNELSAAGVKIPETDMNANTIIALFSGALTPRAEGKYLAPRFTAILETPERFEAHFSYEETTLSENEKAADGPLTPFVIGSIPKTGKPVIFIQERK